MSKARALAEHAAPFIVGEVSKNWPEGAGEQAFPRLLSERFEVVIETNRRRGYKLHSWALNTTPSASGVIETIIAVFQRASQA